MAAAVVHGKLVNVVGELPRITPDKPSRVLEMYRFVKQFEPSLDIVDIEEEDLPRAVRGRIY